jgi:hypothetical protein
MAGKAAAAPITAAGTAESSAARQQGEAFLARVSWQHVFHGWQPLQQRQSCAATASSLAAAVLQQFHLWQQLLKIRQAALACA